MIIGVTEWFVINRTGSQTERITEGNIQDDRHADAI